MVRPVAARSALGRACVTHLIRRHQHPNIERARVLWVDLGGEAVGDLIALPWRKSLDLITDDGGEKFACSCRHADPLNGNFVGWQLEGDEATLASAHKFRRCRRARQEGRYDGGIDRFTLSYNKTIFIA